jgi:hypothetical protein
MRTAVVEAELPDFKSQPPDLSLSGHRMPRMSIVGIWMVSAFGLAFFGFAIAGIVRWRESRRPIAVQYHRMVPRLRRPLVFRERGLRNYDEELFRSEEPG